MVRARRPGTSLSARSHFRPSQGNPETTICGRAELSTSLYRRAEAPRTNRIIKSPLIGVAFLAGCLSAPASEVCVTSVYWEGFGRPLADGRHHSANELIAAHRTLPFGTRVRVVTSSGRSIVVRIADRGPFVRGRCLDLSLGAARALGIDGIAHVTLQPIE